MSHQAQRPNWQIRIGGAVLSACHWVDNGDWLRLDVASSVIVKHRNAIIEHIAGKAGLFAPFIRNVLNSLLPMELPSQDLKGSDSIGSCLVQVEANKDVTLIYVTGLTQAQIKEWFSAPW